MNQRANKNSLPESLAPNQPYTRFDFISRSLPGNPYGGHTLHEAPEQAAIVSAVGPEVMYVDRGYKGVDIDHVQIWRSGPRRGVRRGLKAMIRLRSAIELTIGHMKSNGRLDRN